MKKIAISVDLEDAWCGFKKEDTFLSEAFQNIFSLFKNKKKPTLFIIGKDINMNKTNLRKAVKMGFELGNHGFSHNYLDGLNKIKIKKEICSTHKALKKFGPVISFRAPGWSSNIHTDKILAELGYKNDASRVNGLSFLILKVIHFIHARRITKIFGRFSYQIFQNSFPKNEVLKYLYLKTVCGIPFYNSMLKYFPNSFNIFLIKISTLFNIRSYIFHARDFTNKNIYKTGLILSILSQNYTLTSIRYLNQKFKE